MANPIPHSSNLPDGKNASLSILIVSYNTKALTIACIRSIYEQTECAFEIIVIDNGSVDGSLEEIEKEFGHQLTIVDNDRNLGFAKANNKAAEFANGTHILLLNPDTVVLDRAIDKLLEFALGNTDAGIWGGKTLFADGTLNPTSCWSFPSIWSLFCQLSGLNVLFRDTSVFNPEAMGGWSRDGERFVDVVSGCFFLISQADWNSLGGFNENYFMYGEEVDLCYRARKKSIGAMVSGNPTIIHYGGASERVRADKVVKVMKAKVSLAREHFSPLRRTLGLPMFMLMPHTRYYAYMLLSLVQPLKYKPEFQTWKEVRARKVEWSN